MAMECRDREFYVLVGPLDNDMANTVLDALLADYYGPISTTTKAKTGDTTTLIIEFEYPADASHAARDWNGKSVAGVTLAAWRAADDPYRPLAASNPQQRSRHASVNKTSVLRYPFRAMDLDWLKEYILAVRTPDKWLAMFRIMECLMSNAVLHDDPFLELAAMAFHKCIPPKAWERAKTRRKEGLTFEVTRHVFETIGVAAKYASVEKKARNGLLTMVERLVMDIATAVQSKKFPANLVVLDFVAEVRSRLNGLRAKPESMEAHEGVLAALKSLFFSISSRDGTAPDLASTYVCCECCPCYTRLCSTYTVFISDVERAKMIDCLIIAAMREEDEFGIRLAEELLSRYVATPQFLLRTVYHIHNGNLMVLRVALFEAFQQVRRIQQSASRPPSAVKVLERVEAALQRTKDEIADVKGLCEQIPLVDNALVCLGNLYTIIAQAGSYTQELLTLNFHISLLFGALSTPSYHLAVHGKDPFVGKKNNLRCANPVCPGSVKELLKCSGCKLTYYCCIECQKADWRVHRNLCKEMTSRKASPPSLPCQPEDVYGPLRWLTPTVPV